MTNRLLAFMTGAPTAPAALLITVPGIFVGDKVVSVVSPTGSSFLSFLQLA